MNPFMEISESFGKMIETGKIDVGINKELTNFERTIEKMKTDIITKNRSIEEDFSLFFSLDVQQKILRRMVERITEAEIKMENPKVAKQIMIIIPNMSCVYSLIVELMKKKEVFIRDKLIKMSIELQNLALDQDLFIRKEQSISQINKRDVKTFVNGLTLDIGDSF